MSKPDNRMARMVRRQVARVLARVPEARIPFAVAETPCKHCSEPVLELAEPKGALLHMAPVCTAWRLEQRVKGNPVGPAPGFGNEN